MSEPRLMLQRWPFEPSVAHICEACDYLCPPGMLTCPKCQTKLGEFSRPVKIDAAAAEAMALLNKPAPKPNHLWDDSPLLPKAPAAPVHNTNSYRPDEVLTRCPHCGGIVGIGVRAV